MHTNKQSIVSDLILCFMLNQDCKGLSKLSRPASDLAPEHGKKTLWEEKSRWSCPLPGPQCSTGCRIPQHAGGLSLLANRLRHLSGRWEAAHFKYMMQHIVGWGHKMHHIHMLSEHFIQRPGGVSCVWWRVVSRGGGDLCWKVLQRVWSSGPPGASSCFLQHGTAHIV